MEHGIRWIASIQLDNLNFADDLALLSHTHQQMKTTSVAEASASVRRNIHKGKSKILKYNTANSNQTTIGGWVPEDVETFLDSIIDGQR
ncbi:unnamed protein product [Schistosoma margrebowiei]|uniref:Uncharacterized protein n=1 Tax=Schistosoma margrebowiei TaxID=48269 RepID=A0A183MVK0_9TREM|nr:unnamed protein product [Schistosoma margrebowiei]